MVTTTQIKYGTVTANSRTTYLPDPRQTGTSSTSYRVQIGLNEVTKESTRTKNLSVLRRSGRLPVNPFYYKRVDIVRNGSMSSRLLQGGWESRSTTIGEVDWYGSPNFDLETNIPSFNPHSGLQLEMNLRVKEVKVDLSVLIGERKATIATLQDVVRRVAGAIEGLRKKNPVLFARAIRGDQNLDRPPKPPKKPRRRPPSGAQVRADKAWKSYRLKRELYETEKALYNNWLQWKYGIKPLLQDAYGAAEELAKVQTKRLKEKVVVRRSFSSTMSETRVVDGKTVTVTVSKTKEYRHSCIVDITGSLPAFLSEVGLTNPATVAWELTPLSFVVDWFLPIGDILSNLDVFIGRDILAYSIGEKTAIKKTRLYSYDNPGPGGTYTRGQGTETIDTVIVSRQPGVPGVVLWPQTGSTDFGISKLITSVSLLGQRFRKPPARPT